MKQNQRVAIALFACLVLWCGWQSVSSRQPPPATQKDRTEKSDKSATNKSNPKGFWEAVSTDPVAAFTLALVVVGLFQAGLFFVQLGFIRESLTDAEKGVKAAQDAADAAKLNAQAVMAAEGAHLYPVLMDDNLKEVFKPVIWYDKSGNDSDLLSNPGVTFQFKNYGKTPAVLVSVMFGIDYFPQPSKLRTMHDAEIAFIEVIGPDKETQYLTAELLGLTFTRGKAKSIRAGQGQLLFFGEAVFKDFFNRQFRCIWECEGDAGGFRLIRHEQREDPDAKG